MDQFPRFLTQDQAKQLRDAGYGFLNAYGALSRQAVEQKQALFNITPKFHYFCHALDLVVEERINLKFYTLFAGEDFVGRIARISAKTHMATLGQRTIERYLALLLPIWSGI